MPPIEQAGPCRSPAGTGRLQADPDHRRRPGIAGVSTTREPPTAALVRVTSVSHRDREQRLSIAVQSSLDRVETALGGTDDQAVFQALGECLMWPGCSWPRDVPRPAARTAWTFKAKLPPPGQPQRRFTEDDYNALLASAEAHGPIRRAVDWLKLWVP